MSKEGRPSAAAKQIFTCPKCKNKGNHDICDNCTFDNNLFKDEEIDERLVFHPLHYNTNGRKECENAKEK